MSNKKPNADNVKEEDLSPDDLLLKLFTLRLPMAPDEVPTETAVRGYRRGKAYVKPHSRKWPVRSQK